MNREEKIKLLEGFKSQIESRRFKQNHRLLASKAQEEIEQLEACLEKLEAKEPSILDFNKPQKARPTDIHNEIFQSASGIAGTYESNMSKADKRKFKSLNQDNNDHDYAYETYLKSLEQPQTPVA